MSMSVLRERQKFFFWVVAILVIPSFIILYGGSQNGSREDPPVYEVGSHVVTYHDYLAFYRRMNLGQSGIPQYPVLVDNAGHPQRAQMMQAAAAQYLIGMAKGQRIQALDEEIGSFTRRNPQFQKDGKFDDKMFRDALRSTFNITRQDFDNGISDQLSLMKFERMMDSTALASNIEAYILWAMDNSYVSFDTVTTDAFNFEKEARASITDMNDAIAKFVAAHPKDPDVIGETRWKLEYLAMPYDNAPYESTITEADVTKYMAEHEDEYKNKKAAEVTKEVTPFILRERRARSAQYFMDTTINSELTKLASDKAVTAADVIKRLDTAQAKHFTSGETELMTAGQLQGSGKQGDAGHPLIGHKPVFDSLSKQKADANDTTRKYRLADYLRYIDSKSEKDRAATIEALKLNFSRKEGGAGSDNEFAGYFYNHLCAFRVRVLDVQPGVPLDWRGDVAVREKLEKRLVNAKATELALAALKEKHARLTKNAKDTAGIEFNREEAKFAQMPDELQDALPDMPTAIESMGPKHQFRVLRQRLVPTFEQFAKLDEATRNGAVNRARYNNNRAMYMESAGPRLTAFLRDAQINNAFRLLMQDDTAE